MALSGNQLTRIGGYLSGVGRKQIFTVKPIQIGGYHEIHRFVLSITRSVSRPASIVTQQQINLGA